MRLPSRPLLWLASGALLVACPRSATPAPSPDGAVSLDAGVDAGRRGRDASPTDAAPRWDVYVDPGCDASTRPDGALAYACDPFDPASCDPGLGCYAFAVPPDGPCAEEVFGASCLAAGPGEQGDRCLQPPDCAPGYSCVVTGAGTQCARVCDPGGGEPGCPRGRLCRATDIPGHGACF